MHTSLDEMDTIIKEHLDGALFSLDTITPHIRGKVRDILFKGNTVYFLTTDRISAFDMVLGSIPCKGAALTTQATYWFKESKDIIENHYIECIDPQIMVCKKAKPIPIEVVVRGFLAGSLLREDKTKRGKNYGLTLDEDLKPYQKLPQPIITPTTKSQNAHDTPISKAGILHKGLVKKTLLNEIYEKALALFDVGSKKALEKGLLLVDTKYEFGLIDNRLCLIDEIHTCDSSRYFLKGDYDEKIKHALPPKALDKEFFRKHILRSHALSNAQDLRSFVLSDDIRIAVAKRYFELTELLTNQKFILPKQSAQKRIPHIISRVFADAALHN